MAVTSNFLRYCSLSAARMCSCAMVFLSAAIKACAEDGDIANGRRLFVEGRRAAGVATDAAKDVAAAAVAAAAAAARSGTAPAAPARVNPGVEAVYMSALAVREL